MKSLLPQIKIMLLGILVVCVCVFIFLIGWRLFSFITAPKSPEQLERDADLEYYQRYNKFLLGEKTPEYDYKTYHMIKRDGRYFIIPRSYGTFNGVAFYWPSKTPYSLLKKGSAEDDWGKSEITVFIESKRFGNPNVSVTNSEKACVPEKMRNQSFLWNGLIVRFRFDDIHLADWPKICQETLRILDQVKELKHEQS